MAKFWNVLRSHPLRYGLLLLWLALTVSLGVGAYRLWGELNVSKARLQKAGTSLDLVSGATLQEGPTSPHLHFRLRTQLKSHYQEVVQSTSQDLAQRPQRARALSLLGQLHRQNREFGKALAAHQEAGHLYSELEKESPIAGLVPLQADNQLHLCALLVDLHQIQPALEAATRAKSQLEAMPLDQLVQTTPQVCLAAAHHNLALLALRMGKHEDSVRHLHQRLEILKDLAQQDPESFYYRAPVIDTLQMLTAVQWAGSQLSQAQSTCESILSILTKSEITQFATYPIEQELITVRARIRSNEAELRRASSSGKTSPMDRFITPLPPAWQWRFLADLDHRMIQPDAFVQGSLPGEFEKQDALVLGFCWHHADQALKIQIEMIQACCEHIDVVLLVPDSFAERFIREKLQQAKVPTTRVRFLNVRVDTIWIRDHGPITLRTGKDKYRWADFIYNLPAKSLPRPLDELVPTAAARQVGASPFQVPLFLNGGNLITNGDGLLVATKTLLAHNATGGLSEEHVTTTLQQLTGAKDVVYLDPLVGEPTGDVDWFASFASANTIVVGDFTSGDPTNRAILDRNAERLSRVRVGGEKLRVVRIPMPSWDRDGVGGTYTNVVFANGVLLVPTWSNASKEIETKALNVWRELLPDWKVTPINTDKMGLVKGGLRCATITVKGIPEFRSLIGDK